jgi:hypothetical protein
VANGMSRMTFLTLDFEVVISPDQYIVHRKETKKQRNKKKKKEKKKKKKTRLKII